MELRAGPGLRGSHTLPSSFLCTPCAFEHARAAACVPCPVLMSTWPWMVRVGGLDGIF
jgi:hypothetical protein